MIGIRRLGAVLGVMAWMGSAASAAVVTFSFPLSGAQEVPPNASPGTGTGFVTLDTVTNLLTWDISFSGLTTPVTAAHFHGPAGPGVNAGVLVDIGIISGLSSPMIGSTTVTNAVKQHILNGQTYVNVHTTMFGPGEIRGQVVGNSLITYNFPLDGLQEVPPNPSPGTGLGFVTLDTVTNQLTWHITYQGLFGPVTAAHFHAPGAPGVNAGVALDIGLISGLASPMVGSAVINATLEQNILNGLTYVNIHTTVFGGGEIRGQVVETNVACCFEDASCSNVTPAKCVTDGGTVSGAGCLVVECPSVTLACCFGTGECADMDPTDCRDLSGTPNKGDCADIDCPAPTILGSDPPDGTLDARQPYPPNQPANRQGIGSASEPITVNMGLAGADTDLLVLCESAADPMLGPNGIAAVIDNGDGTYTILLQHAITYNAVTTIEYSGDGSHVAYASHPANANADGVSSPADILFVVDMLNGVSAAPHGVYSQDIDHSLAFGAPDVLRTIDLLNGASGYPMQNFKPAPSAGPCP